MSTERKASGENTCLHNKGHECSVEVICLQEKNEKEPHAYVAEVKIECGDCGARFYFQGMQAGFMPPKPTINALGNVATLHITPQPFHAPDTGGGVPPFMRNA